MSDSEPDTIYHYCSLQSLAAIVQSQSLYMSNLFFLNDSQEYRWFHGVFRECVDRKIASLDSESQHLKLSTARAMLSDGNPCHVYASCFSVLSDDLALWREYGDNGCGVSIGARTQYFEQLADLELLSAPVEYGEDNARTLIDKWIDSTIQVRRADPKKDRSTVWKLLDKLGITPSEIRKALRTIKQPNALKDELLESTDDELQSHIEAITISLLALVTTEAMHRASEHSSGMTSLRGCSITGI